MFDVRDDERDGRSDGSVRRERGRGGGCRQPPPAVEWAAAAEGNVRAADAEMDAGFWLRNKRRACRSFRVIMALCVVDNTFLSISNNYATNNAQRRKGATWKVGGALSNFPV